VAYRVPADAHVHSLARGLSPDGWSGMHLDYQVWPRRPGRFELTLTLPLNMPARKVTLTTGTATRSVTLHGGLRTRVRVPTDGAPLHAVVDMPASPLGGRILGAQVTGLRFVPR
jgi:hypothetical protein